ncbi:hypothetical protein GCM10028805_58270 [Spirosoma harenae]
MGAIPDAYKDGHKLTVKVVPANNISPTGNIQNSPITSSNDCNKPNTTDPNDPNNQPTDSPNLNTPEIRALINFYAEIQNKGISFTDDEKAVIAKYPDLMNRIRDYVNQTGNKPDFVVLLDKYLEDTYAFVTSPAERAILADRSWQDQITFRLNAINASLEAVVRFNVTNCQDNACNAYRHAFFNALNAQSFTVAVARQLGQAREGNRMIDPNSLLPTNFVCDPDNAEIAAAYMDLFNNEWGYRAFNQFQSQGGNLSAIVWTMANNGSLRNARGCP